MTQPQAKEFCEDNGLGMAKISNEVDQTRIADYLNNNMIGALDQETGRRENKRSDRIATGLANGLATGLATG